MDQGRPRWQQSRSHALRPRGAAMTQCDTARQVDAIARIDAGKRAASIHPTAAGPRRPGMIRARFSALSQRPPCLRVEWKLALLLLLSLPLASAPPPFRERVQSVIGAYAHPKSAAPLGYL